MSVQREVPSCRRFRVLGITVGAGQLITVHASYALAAHMGHVPWCIPYWQSCSSISASARHMPEALFFKLTMFPLAACVLLYWRAAADLIAARSSVGRLMPGAMMWLGISAAMFLAGYTALLGIGGSVQRQLRHDAVILSFSFTFLAQLLFTRMILAARDELYPQWNRRVLVFLCLVTITVGIGDVLSGILYSGYDRIDNAIEWNLALLLNAYFLATAFLRCETGLRERNP